MSESVVLKNGECEQREPEWHVLQSAEARQELKAKEPLSEDEVRQRLARHVTTMQQHHVT